MKKLVVIVAIAAVGVLIVAPANAGDKPRSPKACIRALDAAEDVVATTSETLMIASEGFLRVEDMLTAVLDFDSARLDELTSEATAGADRLNELVPQMDAQVATYNRRAEKCRSLE